MFTFESALVGEPVRRGRRIIERGVRRKTRLPAVNSPGVGLPELHADMAGGEARARWPLFTAQVLGLGAASVYAYPLGGGAAPFGVLELYGSSPVALAPSEDVKCRSYAHTIAHAVVAELAPAYALTSGSDVGVFRRGNVNIACGILAAYHRVSVEEAMVRLRARAFSRQHRITSIAQEVINGDRFDTDE